MDELVKVVSTTITYTYDPLNRLKNADYNDGTYFHYTYDAVGNRLTETALGGAAKTYTYDAANRLTGVDGVSYTWNNNGNLLSDGVNTYTYDHANRLKVVSNPQSAVSYGYNGSGDRLRQTVNSVTTDYTLDLNAGLTQTLSDGTNTYLYGAGRIAQQSAAGKEYFLGDALGSVRQLTDATGAVSLARSYQPYGKLLASDGGGETSYGFTGEWTSFNELVYLRARWYAPYLNQFIQADPIVPDPYHPWEWNRFTYSRNNPIRFSDPSGKTSIVPLAAFVLGEPYSGSWQPDGTRNGDKDGKNRTTYYPPKWEQREKDSINQALADVAEAYSNAYIGEIVRRYFAVCWPTALLLESIRRATPENTFLKVHGGRITFVRTAENATQYFSQQNGALTTSWVWANTVDARRILIFSNATANDVVNHPRWIVHEVGHAFERAMEETIGRRIGREGLPAELLVRTAEDDPNVGFAGGFMEWQYSKQNENGEIFADMFIGWVYNQWGVRNGRLTSLAVKRAGYMNSRMPGWITVVILKRGGLP